MGPSDDGDPERNSLMTEQNLPSTENRGLALLLAYQIAIMDASTYPRMSEASWLVADVMRRVGSSS